MATISNSATAFSGGTNTTAATGTHKRFLIRGNWAAAEKISLSVVTASTRYDLGNNDVCGLAPTYCMTYSGRVYLCVGDKVFFSGIDEPTGFEERFAGYGFVQLSGQRGESLVANAVAPYGTRLVMFSRNTAQIWQPNADPTLFQLVQVLDNVGTCAPKSVVSYGDLDVFFVSDSGIRSIRTRENLDLATVKDVGTPIDPLIISILGGLTEAQKTANIVGVYNKSDGRYWISIGNSFYVFSYFPGSQISAWNTYDLATWLGMSTAKVTDVASLLGVSYLKETLTPVVGDPTVAIYYFPGTAYADDDIVTVLLPWFDAKTPSTQKHFSAIDISGQGQWDIYIGDKIDSTTSFTTIATNVDLPTYGFARIPIDFISSHLLVKLTSDYGSATTLSSVILHYDSREAS